VVGASKWGMDPLRVLVGMGKYYYGFQVDCETFIDSHTHI